MKAKRVVATLGRKHVTAKMLATLRMIAATPATLSELPDLERNRVLALRDKGLAKTTEGIASATSKGLALIERTKERTLQ